jgi:hypothetical protein
MRRLAIGLVGALIGALLMLGGTAIAQSLQLKHYGCVGMTSPNPWKPFQYLNKAEGNCPAGMTEIDWIDD